MIPRTYFAVTICKRNREISMLDVSRFAWIFPGFLPGSCHRCYAQFRCYYSDRLLGRSKWLSTPGVTENVKLNLRNHPDALRNVNTVVRHVQRTWKHAIRSSPVLINHQLLQTNQYCKYWIDFYVNHLTVCILVISWVVPLFNCQGYLEQLHSSCNT